MPLVHNRRSRGSRFLHDTLSGGGALSANHGTPPPRLSTPRSTISAHGSGRRPWQFAHGFIPPHSELVGLGNVPVSIVN